MSGNSTTASIAQLSDPKSFYAPEQFLFPVVEEHFRRTGKIDPLAFYAILDWKAPRARNKHLDRLTREGDRTFPSCVSKICDGLASASSAKDRLQVLHDEGFRLPTASAILSILYPSDFTIYDIRVCDAIDSRDGRRFHGLADRRPFEKMWKQYQVYVAAVKSLCPEQFSLRECDRHLWGMNKRATLLRELKGRSFP